MSAENTLTEIGLLFTVEGADAAIEKLRSVRTTTEAVVQTDEERLAAEVRLAAATQRLQDRIETLTLSYVDSKAAVMAYRAEQLGVLEDMEPYIRFLSNLEQQKKEQAAADQQRAKDERTQRGLDLDIARDIQRTNKENEETQRRLDAEAARATKERERAAKAELKAREEYYNGIIEGARKAEQAERDARHKALLEKQEATEKATKLYVEEENARKAAAERAAMQEISWSEKSLRERIRILKELEKYTKDARISPETTTEKFGAGAMKDLPNLPKLMQEYADSLKKVEEGHKSGATHAKSFAEMWKEVTFNTSRARTEMIVLAHEMVQGRFSRIPGSLMVFAEYTDLAALATTGLGLAIIGTTLATAAFVAIVAKGSVEQDKFSTSLIRTGNYAGMTASDVVTLRNAIGGSVATYGEASESILLLANSGRFTREQIMTIAPAIASMAHAGGGEVKKLVDDFVKIAHDPVNAAKKLQEEYHFLTGSVYAQIVALDRQGDKTGAVNLLEAEYARMSIQRSKEMKVALGWVAQAWHAIEKGASTAFRAIMDVGTALPTMLELARTQEQISRKLLDPNSKKEGTQAFNELQFLNNKALELQKKLADEQEKARKESLARQIDDEAMAGAASLDVFDRKYYTPKQRRLLDQARIVAETTKRNIGYLREQGVALDDLDKLRKIPPLPQNADEQNVLDRERNRFAAVEELAKKHGIALVENAEKTEQRLRNVAEKRHDKPIHERDHTELEKFITAENRAVEIRNRIANQEIQIAERRFQTEKRLSADRLEIMRTEADVTNASKTANASVYIEYVRTIEKAEKDRNKAERDALEESIRINDQKQDNIIAGLRAEQFDTEAKKKWRDAEIARAKQAKEDLRRINNEKIEGIDQRSSGAGQEAFSTAFRAMTQEMDRAIVAADKLVKENEAHYRAVGKTKEEVRRLAEAERERTYKALEAELAAERVAMDTAEMSKQDLELQTQRIKKLEKLLETYQKLLGWEKKLKEQQASTTEGMKSGLQQYLDSVDNTFQSAAKLTMKAFKGMEDALTQFVMTGKLNFKGLANSIIADLIRIAIQKQVTGPLATWTLGKMFGTATGTSAAVGATEFAADGGPVSANKLYRVNEEGPELLNINGNSFLMMGSNNGTITPNSAMAQQPVNITINQTVGDIATVSMLQKSNAALAQNIKAAILRSKSYGGALS